MDMLGNLRYDRYGKLRQNGQNDIEIEDIVVIQS